MWTAVSCKVTSAHSTYMKYMTAWAEYYNNAVYKPEIARITFMYNAHKKYHVTVLFFQPCYKVLLALAVGRQVGR